MSFYECGKYSIAMTCCDSEKYKKKKNFNLFNKK